MNILIVNCGSSSQVFKVYEIGEGGAWINLASLKAKNVATQTQADAVIEWNIRGLSGAKAIVLPSHVAAARENLSILFEHEIQVDVVGHRFVHGGEVFTKTTLINEETRAKLLECLPLAPIHNPNSYSVIQVCEQILPGVPQYAVFDTAFHAGIPVESKRYAIPGELAEKYGFRKYGFHGLSYQYVSRRTAALLGKPLSELKLILCHLGTGGSSVTAMREGRSLDTSMGYSPLAGLVMSTRCGDIDPEIILELVRQGYSADQISNILNNQSGLLGLSGYSSNLAEIIAEADNGNTACQAAFGVYAHRLQIYLGAYSWLLGGADAILFTDEIGVNSWRLRETVCGDVQSLGVILDKAANRNVLPDRETCISTEDSMTQIWVVPTNEEQVILEEVLAKEMR